MTTITIKNHEPIATETATVYLNDDYSTSYKFKITGYDEGGIRGVIVDNKGNEYTSLPEHNTILTDYDFYADEALEKLEKAVELAKEVNNAVEGNNISDALNYYKRLQVLVDTISKVIK